MAATGEHQRLEDVAGWYSSREGFYARLVRYGFEALRPHFAGSSCLELGPADGQMTTMLLGAFDELTSVDGSRIYAEGLAEAFADHPGFTAVHSLFEDYRPERAYDTVLATHVLEHVDRPVEVLERCRDWVAPGGRLVVLVPNARSVHRLAAVEMGMLEAPDALNDLDRRLGHRRVYDLPLLTSHLEDAGWTVKETGGVFFKPLSNGQIEDWFTPEMCDAFAALGRRFKENAAEVFAVCS